MSILDTKSSKIPLREVMEELESREPPIVREDASIDDLITAIVTSRHSRMLYVVDNDEQLVGTISLGRLSRHVFAHDREPRIHARSLIKLLAHDSAGGIMRKQPIAAAPDDEIGVVMRRMLEANIKEIPVVDKRNRVIADVTIVDLLRHLLQKSE